MASPLEAYTLRLRAASEAHGAVRSVLVVGIEDEEEDEDEDEERARARSAERVRGQFCRDRL